VNLFFDTSSLFGYPKIGVLQADKDQYRHNKREYTNYTLMVHSANIDENVTGNKSSLPPCNYFVSEPTPQHKWVGDVVVE